MIDQIVMIQTKAISLSKVRIEEVEGNKDLWDLVIAFEYRFNYCGVSRFFYKLKKNKRNFYVN